MKKVYSVKGMHCPSCAISIEEELRDRGVVSCCSYTKTTLEIIDGTIEEDELSKILNAMGYQILKR